jgi:hypothetical protein
MCAVTILVVVSTRSTRRSPQLGTHKPPKPTASPEQGWRPTATVVAMLFVAGSIRDTLFFAAFEIQTALLSIPTQSGLPGIESFAKIGKSVIERCADGEGPICA